MKLLLLAALLVAAAADSSDHWIPNPHAESGYADGYYREYVRPSYHYRYRVNQPHKKLHFSKEEQRDGDRTVGTYSVLLPDSRKQTVTYWVEGDSGFQAVVKYEGVPRYPQPVRYHPHRHSYSDDGPSGGPYPGPLKPGPYRPLHRSNSDDGSYGGPYRGPPKPAPFPPKQVPVGLPSDDGGSKPLPYPVPHFPLPPKHVPGDRSSDDGGSLTLPYPVPQAPLPPKHVSGDRSSDDGGSKPLPYPVPHAPLPPKYVPGDRSLSDGEYKSFPFPSKPYGPPRFLHPIPDGYPKRSSGDDTPKTVPDFPKPVSPRPTDPSKSGGNRPDDKSGSIPNPPKYATQMPKYVPYFPSGSSLIGRPGGYSDDAASKPVPELPDYNPFKRDNRW